MEWGTLQFLQVGFLAAIAIPTHLFVARVRRPLVQSFEASTGSSVRPLAAILDLVAFLIYAGFAAAKVPFGIVGPVGPQDIEQTLDTIGLFALLVAVVQLATPLILHRVANNLEPWPPPGEEEQA